jgi:MYXO-CTERM domain-containing protein
VAALLSVLLLTVPANAEPSGMTPVPPPAAEVTDAVEQADSPAPVEEAGSSPTPVEQVETTGLTNAASEVDVPTEPSEVVSEVEDVASASPSPATQVKHIASSVPSPDEATRSASAGAPVDERHIAALLDGAQRRSTETIAAATERIGPSRGGLALLPGLPSTAISNVAEETQPSTATRVATETTGNRPTPFSGLQRRSDLLSGSTTIELRLKPGEYLTDASSPDTGEAQSLTLHHWRIGLSPPTEIAQDAIPSPGGRHLGNSAPPDLPPLAPPSPAIAVGDGGGPSPVPAVALLALLALAAPAVLRRLGEVAAFRPPTPFACALERPG